MTRAVNLAALAALAGCGGVQPIATTTDELAALRDAWTRAFNARQLDPVIATYALDAVVLPITGGRIVSAAAIKNLYERLWRRLTPRVELASHVVERSGDLAYDSGEYVENLTAGASTVNIAGNYVFVYRHQPDGWRIVEQIWTEATGAPEAGPRAP
jgi:ketosteroid isomerase-like protein